MTKTGRKHSKKNYDITAHGGSVWVTDLISHENEAVQKMMWERYGEYLISLGGEEYKEKVFLYIDIEDSPRSVTYQLELFKKAGFDKVDILHKNSCLAAFGAVKLHGLFVIENLRNFMVNLSFILYCFLIVFSHVFSQEKVDQQSVKWNINNTKSIAGYVTNKLRNSAVVKTEEYGDAVWFNGINDGLFVENMVYENGIMTRYVNGGKEISGKVNYLSIINAFTFIGTRMNKVSWFKGAIASLKVTQEALTPDEFILAKNLRYRKRL